MKPFFNLLSFCHVSVLLIAGSFDQDLITCTLFFFQIFGQQQTFTQSLLGSGQQNFSQLNSQMHAQASDSNDINAASSNQLTNGNQFNPLNNQVTSQVATQLNTQIGGFNQNQFSMQVIIYLYQIFENMPSVYIFQTFKTAELLKI